MVVSGGVIVTGNITGTGGPFGFDTASGKRLWGIPEQMKGEPAADAKSAYVITGGPGVVSRLSSLNLKTGRTQWFAEDVGLGSFRAAPGGWRRQGAVAGCLQPRKGPMPDRNDAGQRRPLLRWRRGTLRPPDLGEIKLIRV